MKLTCGCLVNDGIKALVSPCDEHNPERITDAVSAASATLRDDFARAAMTALIAQGGGTVSNVCLRAYDYADTMLRARRG